MIPGSLCPSESLWVLTGRVDDTATVHHASVNVLPFRVGRHPECELHIPQQAVSGIHAELFERDGSLLIRDMNSTNGTFRNGHRVGNDTPLAEGDTVQFANVLFRLTRQTVDRNNLTVEDNASDLAMMMLQFGKLMSDRAVVPFFQPIVELATGRTVGYESLGRSRLFSLKGPKQMFTAASRLNLESELSRLLRSEGLCASRKLPEAPNLFLNTHPAEIVDEQLVSSLAELRRAAPDQPLTLEIHEAAVTDLHSMRELKASLLDLEIGLAYDDFGAGQSRFLELVEVRPDCLKFDIRLIHRIHEAGDDHQKFVRSLVHMAAELGITPLAEGIECPAERDACRELGFTLGQGYHLGIPRSARCYSVSPSPGEQTEKCMVHEYGT